MKKIAGLLFCLTMMFASAASALDPVYTPVFSNKAIRGYDTVAYFTQNEAVEGKAEFSTEYLGATWLFSSAEHLALFEQNPEEYAPQYGGYCAWAVSQNYTASVEPEQFKIVDGKLYLNYNEEIKERWLGSYREFIEQADKNWPALLEE